MNSQNNLTTEYKDHQIIYTPKTNDYTVAEINGASFATFEAAKNAVTEIVDGNETPITKVLRVFEYGYDYDNDGDYDVVTTRFKERGDCYYVTFKSGNVRKVNKKCILANTAVNRSILAVLKKKSKDFEKLRNQIERNHESTVKKLTRKLKLAKNPNA